MDRNIHQRVLKLRDAALGSRKTVSVSSALARVSYECVVDSLLSLYSECSADQAGLARDKNVARFLNKCTYPVTIGGRSWCVDVLNSRDTVGGGLMVKFC